MEVKQKTGVAILGSTGSIGTQTLEVLEKHLDRFTVEVLTAGRNAKLLKEQALKFKPNAVVIADESQYEELKDALWDLGVKVYLGEEALCQVVEMDEVDIVLTALVGFSGLKPTIEFKTYINDPF